MKTLLLLAVLGIAGCKQAEPPKPDINTIAVSVGGHEIQTLLIKCPRGWMVEYDKLGVDQTNSDRDAKNLLLATLFCRHDYPSERWMRTEYGELTQLQVNFGAKP